eukprot:7508842-Pyramimonas_sp.AAC.1
MGSPPDSPPANAGAIDPFGAMLEGFRYNKEQSAGRTVLTGNRPEPSRMGQPKRAFHAKLSLPGKRQRQAPVIEYEPTDDEMAPSGTGRYQFAANAQSVRTPQTQKFHAESPSNESLPHLPNAPVVERSETNDHSVTLSSPEVVCIDDDDDDEFEDRGKRSMSPARPASTSGVTSGTTIGESLPPSRLT